MPTTRRSECQLKLKNADDQARDTTRKRYTWSDKNEERRGMIHGDGPPNFIQKDEKDSGTIRTKHPEPQLGGPLHIVQCTKLAGQVQQARGQVGKDQYFTSTPYCCCETMRGRPARE